jgi:chorismate lyase / 3-hydroxybenzoate synthase
LDRAVVKHRIVANAIDHYRNGGDAQCIMRTLDDWHAPRGATMMELASPTYSGGSPAAPAQASLPALRISYEYADAAAVLAQTDVLAVIGFGAAAPALAHPAYIRIGLEPLVAPAPLEVWRASAPVTHGHDDAIRWCSDGDYTFAALEVEEAEYGGITPASRHAYANLQAWCSGGSGSRHVLRIWNYLDAINDGEGDAERYRQFCAGRAAGMDGLFAAGYPAATAIGRRDGRRVLQLYWLAARVPGVPLENPRQLSAWRYPRRYGPAAPNFARAMRAPTQSPQLYISGTAAIVGHSSHHAEDTNAQLGETLANLDSLLAGAGIDKRFGENGVLKVYLRDRADAAELQQRLRERVGADAPVLLLDGDVCRAELLVEIDGVHTG